MLDYSPQSTAVATGLADPHVALVGAVHYHAGEEQGHRRNAFSRTAHLGHASSHTFDSTPSTDKPHIPALDGVKFSQVAEHQAPWSRLNTAATSEYSAHANMEHQLVGTLKPPAESTAHKDAILTYNQITGELALSEDRPREGRVNEVIVGNKIKEKFDPGKPGAHAGSLTVPQLALGGAALLTAASFLS